MQPCVAIITIGVHDSERSPRFYRDGLGFQTEGVIGKGFDGAVVFIDMRPGSRLAPWTRSWPSRAIW